MDCEYEIHEQVPMDHTSDTREAKSHKLCMKLVMTRSHGSYMQDSNVYMEGFTFEVLLKTHRG